MYSSARETRRLSFGGQAATGQPELVRSTPGGRNLAYSSWLRDRQGVYHLLRIEDEIDRQVRAERIIRFDGWKRWYGEFNLATGLDELCNELEATMRRRAAEQGLDPLRDGHDMQALAAAVRHDFALTGPGSVDGDPNAALITRMEQRKAFGRPPLLGDLTPDLMKALFASGATTRDLKRLYDVEEEIRDLRDAWRIEHSGLPWDKLHEMTSLT